MGPYRNQYNMLSREMDTAETPLQTIRKMVREAANVELMFVSHSTSFPAVLDTHTVRLQAPLYVQLTSADDQRDFVDYVYLAQAKTAPSFSPDSNLGWFRSEDLIGKKAPRHVKRVVKQVLELVNQ